MTALVIHGHVYQPRREHPWSGAVEREPSAHPDHDGNRRTSRLAGARSRSSARGQLIDLAMPMASPDVVGHALRAAFAMVAAPAPGAGAGA